MQVPRQPAKPREYVLVAASVLVTLVLTGVYYNGLPDPVASHWNYAGMPDGSMPKAVDALLIPLLVSATGWLIFAAGRADRQPARLLVAMANGLAVFFVGMRYLTYAANANAATWQEARPLTIGVILPLMALACAAGAFGWLAARSRPGHVVQVRAVSAADSARAPERFDAYVSARFLTILPFVALASGGISWLLLPAPGGAFSAASAGFAAAIIAVFTRAHVQVDAAVVKVRLGPFGFPVITRAIADITEVSVMDVEPIAYGGWGYRVVPGARALVLRRGEGVRIAAAAEPDLIVTVDQADLCAAVIARHMPPQ